MEIRDFAATVLFAEDLETKLAPPPGPLSDEAPGAPIGTVVPGRAPHLRMLGGRKIVTPSLGGMPDPRQRPRILHSLANHELQAAELFAWALLAFPDAPAEFRRGLVTILTEEQRHTRMYRARLTASGADLGDYPLHGYFWGKVGTFTTPLRFVCAMSLTFENANLDHTIDYAAAARAAHDEKTALVIDRIHDDEIGHVRFGWHWLGRMKSDDRSMWEAFTESLTWPLRPLRAKGRTFDVAGREAAGLDADFISRLEAADR